MPATEFEALSEALARAGALGEPAEMHGQLCGLACQFGADTGPPWVAESLADSTGGPEAIAAARELLQAVAAATLAALDRGDMSLRLALPDDEAAIDLRTASLAYWCQGFMHGLSHGDGTRAAIRSGVGREIVEDFVAISRAEPGDDETPAQAEAAYSELVEFVRVSVQLLFEELHADRDPTVGDKSH